MLKSTIDLKRNKKRFKKIKIIVGAFSVFFVLFVITIIFLATKDDYIDAYNGSSESELACKIGTSILSNQEIIIKPEKFNSFFNFFMKTKNDNSDIILEGVNILENDKDGNFKMYLPITKNGAHFGMFLDANISFLKKEKYLKFDVKGAKIGRLPIPKFIFFALLKRCLSKNYEVKDNSLLIPASVNLEFMGSDLVFNIQNLKFSKENLIIKFSADKKLLREFVENKAKQFISGNVKDLFCKLVKK